MSDEKTEQPTDKKLRDARRDGEVSKSKDLIDGFLLAGALLALCAAGAHMMERIRASILLALDFVHGDHDMVALYSGLVHIGANLLSAVLPVLLAAAIAALAALAPQVGFQISMKPVAFKFDAISPVAGIKKIFSVKALIDLVKMVLRSIIVLAVLWQMGKNLMPLVAGALYQTLPELMRLIGEMFFKLFAAAAAVFIILGAADVKLQQFLFIRGKKMSKDEIKREHKQQEGDPMLKGERKRLGREMATSAPRQGVAGANVLVVNPTHYAVAIRYVPAENPLPVILAKGMDRDALRMRHEASLANIPIVGNPPVARALHKVATGAPIPEEMFEVVAAILRWVQALGLNANADAAQAAQATPSDAGAHPGAATAATAATASSAAPPHPIAMRNRAAGAALPSPSSIE